MPFCFRDFGGNQAVNGLSLFKMHLHPGLEAGLRVVSEECLGPKSEINHQLNCPHSPSFFLPPPLQHAFLCPPPFPDLSFFCLPHTRRPSSFLLLHFYLVLISTLLFSLALLFSLLIKNMFFLWF